MSSESNNSLKLMLAIAVAQGQKIAEWAAKNGVPERTAYTWANEPKVRTEVANIRRRSIEAAIGLMAESSPDVVKVMLELTQSDSPKSVRLAASRALMSHFIKISNFSDIETRIGKLENKRFGVPEPEDGWPDEPDAASKPAPPSEPTAASNQPRPSSQPWPGGPTASSSQPRPSSLPWPGGTNAASQPRPGGPTAARKQALPTEPIVVGTGDAEAIEQSARAELSAKQGRRRSVSDRSRETPAGDQQLQMFQERHPEVSAPTPCAKPETVTTIDRPVRTSDLDDQTDRAGAGWLDGVLKSCFLLLSAAKARRGIATVVSIALILTIALSSGLPAGVGAGLVTVSRAMTGHSVKAATALPYVRHSCLTRGLSSNARVTSIPRPAEQKCLTAASSGRNAQPTRKAGQARMPHGRRVGQECPTYGACIRLRWAHVVWPQRHIKHACGSSGPGRKHAEGCYWLLSAAAKSLLSFQSNSIRPRFACMHAAAGWMTPWT